MSSSNVPAKWYADPSGQFELRYWDGDVWTDHVATKGKQGVSPLVPTAVVPAATPKVADGPGTDVAVAAGKEPGMFARLRNERKDKLQDRDQFEALALQAAAGDAAAFSALPAALAEARGLWRAGKFEAKAWEAMTAAVRHVISDDVMTVDEEAHLHRLGAVLGTPVDAIGGKNFPLLEELVIAGINDGRFPRLEHPPIMVKNGERAYGSFGVALMKEVTIREFRGGSSSVSVPLGGGVRYRVGGFLGRSVVVGTELVAQDTGILVVTSTRSVFIGQKKTLEFRNDKLLGLEQFTDGLRLNVSNRQTASLFKMPPGQSPSIAAALISASSSAS
jgi:uncharacterized protein DUF2510